MTTPREEAAPSESIRAHLQGELREKLEEALPKWSAARVAEYLWPWLEAELCAERRLTLEEARIEAAIDATPSPDERAVTLEQALRSLLNAVQAREEGCGS